VPKAVCLLVNPAAGGGRAGRLAPRVQTRLRELGLTVSRRDTRDLDHAKQLAREAASAGETVAVLSGDGMIGAVADALRELPGSVLAVLPGGRGNDLARTLGIPLDPVQACETVAGGIARKMDLGEVSGAGPSDRAMAFVGIASAGFDSDANRIANEAPSRLGNLVYAYGALRALLSWRPATFTLELDPPGERRSFTGYSFGAANSQSYGGGMRAAPGARLDDGLLEVLVLERIGKLRFLTRLLPKVFSGTHIDEPGVTVMSAHEIVAEADRPFTMYADGDPIGELPVRVRALAGAITVLVPEHPDGTNAFTAEPSKAIRSDHVETAALDPPKEEP
jgi:YegS/Rv2252/BmrU family lipid kinase